MRYNDPIHRLRCLGCRSVPNIGLKSVGLGYRNLKEIERHRVQNEKFGQAREREVAARREYMAIPERVRHADIAMRGARKQ